MDQGPITPPPRRPWQREDVVALLRAVAVQWAVAIGLSVAAAAVWSRLAGHGFRDLVTTTTLVVAAGLPVLFGIGDLHERSFVLDDPSSRRGRPRERDHGLTVVGSFLLVSVPLALLGLWVGS